MYRSERCDREVPIADVTVDQFELFGYSLECFVKRARGIERAALQLEICDQPPEP
jgi:hypothetical protein